MGGVGSVGGALLASIGAGILTAAITLVSQPLYAQVVLLVLFVGVLALRRPRA